jgi:hypothetical protein
MVLVALVLGACGLACDGGSASHETAATAADDVAAAKAAVEAIVLREGDVPAPYAPSDDDDESLASGPQFAMTGECAEFNDLLNDETGWADSIAEKDGRAFEREDAEGFENMISSGAAVYADADEAQEIAGATTRLVELCEEQFETAVREHIESSADGDTPLHYVEVDIEPLTVEARGDASAGLRFTTELAFEEIGARWMTETIWVRVGRMVAVVDHAYSIDPDLPLRDDMLAIVAERLVDQEGKLPD